jgi:hypothetical protein
MVFLGEGTFLMSEVPLQGDTVGAKAAPLRVEALALACHVYGAVQNRRILG